MSWKLAELRWRQDVGLTENCRDRNNGGQQDESFQDSKSNGHEQQKRGRSYTAPWCHVVVGDSLPEYSRSDAIPPDPAALALSPAPSDTSSTPLLSRKRGIDNTFTEHDHNHVVEERNTAEHGVYVDQIQTPFRPTSLPCRTIQYRQLDCAEGTSPPQTGSLFCKLTESSLTI